MSLKKYLNNLRNILKIQIYYLNVGRYVFKFQILCNTEEMIKNKTILIIFFDILFNLIKRTQL